MTFILFLFINQLKKKIIKGVYFIIFFVFFLIVIGFNIPLNYFINFLFRVEYIPREKRVTDYYAVEYQTEYIP